MAKITAARLASGNPVVVVYLEKLSDGTPFTGLTNSSTGLGISHRRELASSATKHLVSASNVETITTLGTYAAPTTNKCRFKEIDATDMPGFYEIHLPQAAVGTGDASRFLTGTVRGVTDLRDAPFEVELVPDAIPNDSTQLARVTDVATVASYVDTEIASILADLATLLTRLSSARAGYLDNLSAGAVATAAAATAIETDTQDIQARLPDALTPAGNMKSDALRINGTTVQGAGTSGNKWRG